MNYMEFLTVCGENGIDPLIVNEDLVAADKDPKDMTIEDFKLFIEQRY